MSLNRYIRETTALTGPLARRLCAEHGEISHSHLFHFPHDALTRDVILPKEADITCVDTRFQIWSLLGSFNGEIAHLEEPGVIVEKAKIAGRLNILLEKFPSIVRINIFAHTDCGAVANEIKYHQAMARPDGIAGAVARSTLEMSQLQVLYAMYCALEASEQITGINKVSRLIRGEEIDILPAFIASELICVKDDGTKTYRDRIAPFDFEKAQFTLPRSRQHMEEILGRTHNGDRVGALNAALGRGQNTYEEAIRQNSSELVISL